MDEAQREYLNAINKMVDNTIPQQPALPDEVVWVEMFKAIVISPKSHGQCRIEELADAGLEEFKKRFRE